MGNPLTDLWNSLVGWKDRNAAHYLYEQIPRERTDVPNEPVELAPYQSYFRLWLKEMYLAKSRRWFTDWYPAVTALVKLKFADRDGVTLSSVAQPPEGKLSQGVFVNYRLTELLPYNGGAVEIDSGLIALKGANHLAPAIRILQSFSGLVAAPLLPVLSIAEKVATGMQDLVGSLDGEVHLSLHDTFTTGDGGGAKMRAGYAAVVLATDDQVKPGRLSVRENRLQYAATPGGAPQPLGGFDYMLFHIEGRTERDDWRLSNIQKPLEEAIAALIAGEKEKADALTKVALTAAMTSPDLAVQDRRRVALAIRDELKAIAGEGLGATGGEVRDLQGIVRARAKSRAIAAQLPELTFEELFGR
jgi:hypothetical protein